MLGSVPTDYLLNTGFVSPTRDQGPGFDITTVPDPTDDENLDKPGGRGIMLMRAFMSLVEYNQTGNRLTLEKRRDAEEAE